MKTMASAVLALSALLILGGSAAANAEADDYTPTDPATPTLAGSTAVGECDRDVPWISYDISLIDTDGQFTTAQATLVLTNGEQSTSIALGALVGGELSGRVLWPGASIDAEGNATGWPGWAFENGQWVETEGNFRWTRGAITATIEVNPSVVVPVSYPPSTPMCAADPPRRGSAAALPATGVSAIVLPIAVVGVLAAITGILLVVGRRLARR